MATQEELYSYHSENFRAVSEGFQQTAKLLERAVGADDARATNALTRICAFLLSAKIEARFYKLLFEPPVPDEFRDRVNRGVNPSLIEKWHRTIEEAFRQYHGVEEDFMGSAAPASAKAQFGMHNRSLAQLEPIIELRNKIAHGQWEYALNNRGTEVNPEKTRQLAEENLLSLRLKDRLAQVAIDAINDLVVSWRAHDRDLDKHKRVMEDLVRELETRSYEKYARNVRVREWRSQNQRRRAVGKPPLPGPPP